MITREDYIKALDTVETYHRQLDIAIAKHGFSKSMDDLERGDYVECVKVHNQSRYHLTKGKKYEILSVADHYGKLIFYIRTDKDIVKRYNGSNSQFISCI